MDCLPLTDAERVVHLVSQAGDPTVDLPIPQRKQLLLRGLAELVCADIWYWCTTVMNPEIPGDVMLTALLDGGWTSDEERANFYRVLTAPEVRPLAASVFGNARERHVTHCRERIACEESRAALDGLYQAMGIGHFLVSMYPLSEVHDSAISFYRRRGKAAFDPRDRALVHLVVSQVDWLHRYGIDVPAGGTVLQLTPRERQVMIFLLGGDSVKQIAGKLKLSEFTVGDYVKQIYKHFAVSSRGELMSHFITGGQ